MFTRLRAMRRGDALGLVAVGVVVTLVLSGTAMAVTDTSFTYSTVQTGYLHIGPGDLVPNDDSIVGDFFLDATFASSDSVGCFVAGIHLPQGSRITSVRSSYLSGTGHNPYFEFRRANPVTVTDDYLFQRSISDDSGTVTYVNDVVPPTLALVNNALYTYTYHLCVGTADAFLAARIAYQYRTAGD